MKRSGDGLLLAYLALLLFLNLFPAVPTSPVENGDKLAHFLMFLLLGFIGFARWPCLLPVPFLTEPLQLFIPGRTFSLWDMAANLIGFSAGVVIGWWYEGSRGGASLLDRGRD
ncbi:VanZ family protein [Thermococcus pacificus]|uniref:VanZ family protein n=1 Tax=Thermococcus pacificus TaxID=71998 RepID=UPI000B59AF68|nr:VanZ family protein [Thermococcus pacificus]